MIKSLFKKNKYINIENKAFFSKKIFQSIHILPKYNQYKKAKVILQLINDNKITLSFNTVEEAQYCMNKVISEIEQ